MPEEKGVTAMFWICTDAMINWPAVTGVGQLAVGAAVFVVAYRQWQTARNKLKSDIYERRRATYSELVSSVKLITEREMIENPDRLTAHVVDIERIAQELAWVFGEKVGAKAWKIYEAALDLEIAQTNALEASRGSDRRELIDVYHARFADVHLQLSGLTRLITPLMRLEH